MDEVGANSVSWLTAHSATTLATQGQGLKGQGCFCIVHSQTTDHRETAISRQGIDSFSVTSLHLAKKFRLVFGCSQRPRWENTKT
jgi:hypothetical protein